MNNKKEIAAEALGEVFPGLDALRVCGYGVLLFLAMTVQTGQASILLGGLALLLALGRAPARRLRERLSLPLLGFWGFALMNGLAALYASVGAYAVAEFNKFLASFALAAILLVRFDRRHVRGLLWALGAVCAVLGLVCVDMGCSTGLFHLFNNFARSLGMDYLEALSGSQGNRVNGLYMDANITGAVLGPAILVCMYLVHTGKRRWEQGLGCLLLGVCSLGFLTALSRGAIAIFSVAALVYLAAEREDRLGLFFLMCATAFSMLGAGGLALANMRQDAVLPDVLCFVCGLVIFLLDWRVNSRLSELLRGRGKLVAIFVGGIAVLLLGLLAVSLSLTGPYTFSEGKTLYRSVKLDAGTYEPVVEWEGEIAPNAVIIARSAQDSLLERDRLLYSGPLEDMSFTLEEDGLRVIFNITAGEGTVLRSLELSDGTDVKLKYRLLPSLAADRLHDGLLEGYSFQMRIQYNKDGWRLFLRSPILGHGLGSSESWLTSLQPFFYESLFLHNHILQVMCDMGLAGLLFWLLFLGGALWLMFGAIRKEKDPLSAALLGCWAMMVLHGLMEIDFSIRAFQCEAWLLLLLPVILYVKPLSSKKLARMGSLTASLVLWLYLGVFTGLLESRRMAAREMEGFSTGNAEVFMSATKRWAEMDRFDPEQQQLNYVGNAVILGDAQYREDMERYAKALRKSGTYTACSGLAKYYYLPRGEYEQMFACSREGVAQEASVSDAWNQQFDFYRLEVLPEMNADWMPVFVSGVLDLRDDLDAFDEGRLESIALTEENRAFVERVQTVRDNGMDGAAALLYLSVFGAAEISG